MRKKKNMIVLDSTIIVPCKGETMKYVFLNSACTLLKVYKDVKFINWQHVFEKMLNSMRNLGFKFNAITFRVKKYKFSDVYTVHAAYKHPPGLTDDQASKISFWEILKTAQVVAKKPWNFL